MTNPTDPFHPKPRACLPGINMRNYLAGLAMQGLCANPVKFDAAMIAVGSIAMSDALIAALNASETVTESNPLLMSQIASQHAPASTETDEQFVMRWVKFHGARKLEFDGSLWRAFENDMNIFITPTLSQLAELIRSYGFN